MPRENEESRIGSRGSGRIHGECVCSGCQGTWVEVSTVWLDWRHRVFSAFHRIEKKGRQGIKEVES